jgi:hypothetical protein
MHAETIFNSFAIVGALLRVMTQPNYLALGPLAAFGLGVSFAADLDLYFYAHLHAPPLIISCLFRQYSFEKVGACVFYCELYHLGTSPRV